MSVVQVTGLPNTVKMPKLVFTLRVILKKVEVQKFWIKELADMRNCDLKEAKIAFLSDEDAQKVASTLDNFLFHEGKASSHLMTKVIGGDRKRRRSPSPHRERNSSRHRGEYSERRFRDRNRSRSPIYNEASKLDMELELLRKQRMVIEEERRLLLERKKLELIKEFGPSASREFEHMERSRDRRKRPRREERPLSPRPSFQPKARPMRPKTYAIPLFHGPSKAVMAQMEPIITGKAKPEEKSALSRLLRMQVRKRIAILLADKEFISGEKILKLYRETHPSTSDEEMVTSELKNLRLSQWPVTKIKKKEDNVSESIDNETKDPPQENEKTETDTDTTKPAAVDMNVEPIKEPIKDEPKKEVAAEPEVIPEEIPQKLPEEIKEESPKQLPDEIKEVSPQKLPEKIEEESPQKLPEEVPETITKEDSAQVEDKSEDDADAGDITVELTLNGPDDEWIENGIGWNDEDGTEQTGDPVEL